MFTKRSFYTFRIFSKNQFLNVFAGWLIRVGWEFCGSSLVPGWKSQATRLEKASPGWKKYFLEIWIFSKNRSKSISAWSYEKTEGTVKISVKNHADLWVQTIFFIYFLGFFDKNPILDHDMAILRAPSASSPNLGCYTTKNH